MTKDFRTTQEFRHLLDLQAEVVQGGWTDDLAMQMLRIEGELARHFQVEFETIHAAEIAALL